MKEKKTVEYPFNVSSWKSSCSLFSHGSSQCINSCSQIQLLILIMY